MIDKKPDMAFTVIIAVVSGKNSLRNCLANLVPQMDFRRNEIIVPYDKWSSDIGDLVSEFPKVNFHYIEDLGLAASPNVTAHQHRLFDRRRAVGLQLARGKIIAMTEDHAVPAEDWCRQMLKAHEQSNPVIGGAIENCVDRPLNWAWYYCDFGRYGRPLPNGEIHFVSDVNVSYKREAIKSVREIWDEAYHETNVHWALRSRNIKLCLDKKIVVYQSRPKISLSKALIERMEWGQIFAETRTSVCSNSRRFMFAIGIFFLPGLLLIRIIRNMLRHGRSFKQMTLALPIAFLLLLGWSLGELIGYISGNPFERTNNLSSPFSKKFVSDQH